MTFSFHPEALGEFHAAIDYYEQCESGLGLDFAIEVRSSIENILRHPKAWPVLRQGMRRCLTRRFPSGVSYTLEPPGIIVLAVMHLHRNPDYWKERRPV